MRLYKIISVLCLLLLLLIFGGKSAHAQVCMRSVKLDYFGCAAPIQSAKGEYTCGSVTYFGYEFTYSCNTDLNVNPLAQESLRMAQIRDISSGQNIYDWQ